MRRDLAGRMLAGLLALSFLVPVPGRSQTPSLAPAASEAGASLGIWPRQIQAGGAVIEVYQPQIDSWLGSRLEARAALSLQAAGSSAHT